MSKEEEYTMKWEVDADELQKALKLVAPAIDKRAFSVEVKGVWIQQKDGRVIFRATDYNLSVLVPIVGADVATHGEHDRIVSFESLAGVVATFPTDATVLFDGSKPELRVTAGATRVDLPCLSEHRYPDFPGEGGGEGVLVSMSAFSEMFKLAGYATSSEASRPLLQQVLLEHNDDRARLVTCDSHRLVAAEDKPWETSTRRHEFLLPPNAAKLAAQMFPGEVAKVRKDTNHVHFDGQDGKRLTVRLVGGSYPNIDEVTPKRGAGLLATFSVDSLVRAAKLVKATSDAPYCLSMEFVSSEEVEVTGGADAKILETLLTGSSTVNQGFEVMMNATFIIDALSRWPSDYVELGFTSPVEAIRLDVPADEDSTPDIMAIVHPLRPI